MEHFRHFASIGTHSLSFALRGTPRQPGAPRVIIMTGVTSSALECSAVCRHLESEATILLYERSGHSCSEKSSEEPLHSQWLTSFLDYSNRLLLSLHIYFSVTNGVVYLLENSLHHDQSRISMAPSL